MLNHRLAESYHEDDSATRTQGGAKWVRANEQESFLVHESEFEPSSGNVKTEGSSKGFWYPEELDRDIWCS